MPRALRTLPVLAALLAQAAPVLAAPLSGAPTGVGERTAVAASFLLRLGASAAPFVALLAIVAVVQRGWPPWRGEARGGRSLLNNTAPPAPRARSN